MVDLKFDVRSRLENLSLPPLIVAEAGVNHFKSLERAERLIQLASSAGCECIKFQHYNADDLYADHNSSWYRRLKSRDTNLSFCQSLLELGIKYNIFVFFTAHTHEALSDLVELNATQFVKIGSGERGNYSLIKAACENSYFTAISTGTYEQDDLVSLSSFLSDITSYSTAVMHCTTLYPTPPSLVNLNQIYNLKSLFPTSFIGYSDHTEGFAIPLASTLISCNRILEKHISLEANLQDAQDWRVSCFADDLNLFVSQVSDVYFASSTSSKSKSISSEEKSARAWANKSPYLKQDFKYNSLITDDCFCYKRPYTGISCTDIERVIGSRYVGHDLVQDTPITSDFFDFVE